MPKFDFLKKTLTKFAKDEKGSFAILFALVAVILIFAAGTAIDYTRAINEQDRMQRAIDAAVLAGATQSQTISDTDAIEQAALDVFNINYQVSSGTTIEAPTFTYSPTQRELVGTINGTVPTTLSRVMGIETIDVGVNATASLGVTRVEYVLAIDQSGSMKTFDWILPEIGYQFAVDSAGTCYCFSSAGLTSFQSESSGGLAELVEAVAFFAATPVAFDQYPNHF